MTASDLSQMTAAELKQLFAEGRAAPSEAVAACLDRIRRHDEEVKAFCDVDEEKAYAEARRSDERWRRGLPAGLLEGVPVAIKDSFKVRGWPARDASRVTSAEPANRNAPPTQSLVRHGAVPLGRTTMPEFAWKGVTDSPIYGVSRNPWDPRLTPGGSSGGSATAVALGMAPIALGSDAAGSVRIPASFCGVFGFKPTRGRAPMWPPSPFAPLGHIGTLTWTVADAALMMAVLSEEDWQNRATPTFDEDILHATEGDVRGMRIAYCPSFAGAEVDAEVSACTEQAATLLEDRGALVETVDDPFGDIEETFLSLYYGSVANQLRNYSSEERARMDPALVEAAESVESLGMLDYLGAMNHRMELIERMESFHRHWNLLLTPVVPVLPFEAGRNVPTDWPSTAWHTWSPFTWPFNITGQPACSVPGGFTESGLPIGLQLVGPRWAEPSVLGAAHTLQSAQPLTDRRPPMVAA